MKCHISLPPTPVRRKRSTEQLRHPTCLILNSLMIRQDYTHNQHIIYLARSIFRIRIKWRSLLCRTITLSTGRTSCLWCQTLHCRLRRSLSFLQGLSIFLCLLFRQRRTSANPQALPLDCVGGCATTHRVCRRPGKWLLRPPPTRRVRQALCRRGILANGHDVAE